MFKNVNAYWSVLLPLKTPNVMVELMGWLASRGKPVFIIFERETGRHPFISFIHFLSLLLLHIESQVCWSLQAKLKDQRPWTLNLKFPIHLACMFLQCRRRTREPGLSPPHHCDAPSWTQCLFKPVHCPPSRVMAVQRMEVGTHGSMATAAAPDGIPLFLAARLWHSWWTAALAIP